MCEPKPGEALFKVDTVGICGSDIHYYINGGIADRIIKKPHILGHEVSGIIEAVGENDFGIKEGMSVGIEPIVQCCKCEPCIKGEYNHCENLKFCGSPPYHGGMREYMTYPVQNLFPIPDTMTAEEGVFLETLSVCIHSVDESNIKIADSVVIFGAGNIGLSILQLVRLAGAFDIYVVDPLDYRLKIAEELGATVLINPNREEPVEKILKLTNGKGVDIGFEAAGDEATPQQTINSIKRCGTFAFVGIVPKSFIQWDTELTRKMGINIKVIHKSRHSYTRAIQLIKKDKFDIKPFITHRFALEKTEEAFKTVENYKDNVLKAVIKP